MPLTTNRVSPRVGLLIVLLAVLLPLLFLLVFPPPSPSGHHPSPPMTPGITGRGY